MAYHDVKTPWEGWRVINKIGKGGFGSVYEIERSQYGIQERAAMKVITIPQSADEIDDLLIEGYDDNSITQRFDAFAEDIVREYGMMAQMKGNANIVYCDDYRIIQQDNGFGRDIYIRMELLTPLLKAMDRVSSESQIIRFGMEMCNALEACQKRTVIHRDIKPQNIFVTDDGVFKLGDFGIARKAEKTTRATVGKGTYQFMAPEVKNELPYGPTVDMYSLGLVMYWLLNNRRCPFFPLPPAVPTHKEEQEALRRRFAGEKIPAPKNGSEELKRIVLKACAFEPKDRYQSAREMREDLECLLEGHVPVRMMQFAARQEGDFADATVGSAFRQVSQYVQIDDEEKTVGPVFGAKVNEDSFGEGKTVGPVFASKLNASTTGANLGVGPGFPPKKKAEKKKRKWPMLAAVLCLILVISAVLFIGTGDKNGQGGKNLLGDADNLSGETRIINWVDEIEQFRATHKTYSLAELIDLTDGLALSKQACWESLTFDNVIIRRYNTDSYSSIQAIYLNPVDGSVVYGDDFAFMVNREENTSVPTYSRWVNKSVYEQIKTIKSSSNTAYYWHFVDIQSLDLSYDTIYVQAYIDGYATEAFISKEFYDEVGLYANELKEPIKVVAGEVHNVALYSDGTVKSSGLDYHGEGNVEDWCDIIDICATEGITVGLKRDGTVVAVGNNTNGQCNVSDWTDISAIAASGYNVIGVKQDGTVEAVGNNDYGQCNVDSWTGIVQADIGTTHSVGLRADGTVVATGDNEYGQCNVSEWTDIVSIKVAYLRTIGLKADGTVVATGGNFDGECDVSSWTDIVAIDTDGNHTVGLKSDGTVVAAGFNSWESFGACNVSEWTDIIYVEVGYYRTIGLKSDGTIVVTGWNDRGQCDIGELSLQ